MDEEVKLSEASARIGSVVSPAEAIALAIREARKGIGFVSPNPLVGCAVLDRKGRLISVGHHARVGGDHAEVMALKRLSEARLIQGSHWFVTLEPCAHQGRTPSCARTLAPLGIASLTYAVEDPNPLVSGKGAAILREAGVDTKALADRHEIAEREELIARAEDLAEIFLHRHRHDEPFVAVKIAMSLDGQMALSNGQSKWLTGVRAREHAHSIRARYDAVMVGASTFLADDPALNIRHEKYPNLLNSVVLIDPQGRCLEALPASNLLKVRPADRVLVIAAEENQERATRAAMSGGWRSTLLSRDEQGEFSPRAILRALKREGLSSIMIEGGARTIGAFVRSRKVHRLHAYVAPKLIGGRNAIGWSDFFGVSDLAEATSLERSRRRVIGDDLYWTARVFRGPNSK